MDKHRPPAWPRIVTALLVDALAMVLIRTTIDTIHALDRNAADAAAWGAAREASR